MRRLPAELLRHLVAERLAPLRVEGPHVDVDDGPTVVVRELAAQPVDLIVRPVDGDEGRPVHCRPDDLAAFQVGGEEDLGVQSRLRPVRRDRTHEVPGRDASERLELELQRLAGRHAHRTVLERVRRVHGVVLDVQVFESQHPPKIVRLDERREPRPHVEGRVRADGQEIMVPPHGGRAVLDALTGDVAGHRVVVVADLKRAETEFAHVERLDGILLAASTTGKRLCERHTDSSGTK